MTLLVDTSVWSLAFRRDAESLSPQVAALRAALDGGESIVTTGLILQELLQGFVGARAQKELIQRFAALPSIVPDRRDHIDAANLRILCRRAGVQLGTIDALLAQLCIRHELTMLTTDHDYSLAAEHCALRVWEPQRYGTQFERHGDQMKPKPIQDEAHVDERRRALGLISIENYTCVLHAVYDSP